MPSASIRPPALVRSQSSWSIAGAHYKHWATSLGNFGVTQFFGGNLYTTNKFAKKHICTSILKHIHTHIHTCTLIFARLFFSPDHVFLILHFFFPFSTTDLAPCLVPWARRCPLWHALGARESTDQSEGVKCWSIENGKELQSKAQVFADGLEMLTEDELSEDWKLGVRLHYAIVCACTMLTSDIDGHHRQLKTELRAKSSQGLSPSPLNLNSTPNP